MKWACQGWEFYLRDSLHPESAMAFTDLCLVPFLPHQCLPPPPPPLSGNSLTLISKHLQKARRGERIGGGLRWLKEMIRRFLFLSAYSSFNDQPWLCLCPALLSSPGPGSQHPCYPRHCSAVTSGALQVPRVFLMPGQLPGS